MLNGFQIFLLTLWSFWGIVDALSFGIGFNNCILACWFAGLVVGNPTYGLVVGGTLQMTQLGVGTYGGASIPNITSSGMITTALGASAVAANASTAELSEAAVTMAASVGVALASLFTELDILARFTNTAFQHAADRCLENGDEKGIERNNVLGVIPWGLSRALPVLFLLAFGQGMVDKLLAVVPQWLMDGFRIAGGLLPAVGFAILMRYLPVQKEPQYLLLGFALVAYLGNTSFLTKASFDADAAKLTTGTGSIGFTILGTALVGLVIAITVYQREIREQEAAAAASAGGDDIDD